MLLPSIPSIVEYRPLYRDERVWLPALRAICAKHGLNSASLRLAPPGSNVVFWVEEDLLIKLFAPIWPDNAQKETAVLKALAGRLPFDIPRITAEGELEGWPYLVLTRLPGQPLDNIWDSLPPEAHLQIAASLGSCIAALQVIPASVLEGALDNWPGSWEKQIAACLKRQREMGVAACWLDQIAAFLEDALPGLRATCQPVVLHADLNPEHLFCQETPSGWQVTGMIDFADAMLGYPFYEWVRPGYTLQFEPALLRAMLLAAGFGPTLLDPALSQNLLACTFLHRFFELPEIFDLLSFGPPASLAELQASLWSY